LIIHKNNQVHGRLLGSLYEAKSYLPIYLLTRHGADLLFNMRYYYINPDFFDAIIHDTELKKTKYDLARQYVPEGEILLIDDNYDEKINWLSYSCDPDEGSIFLEALCSKKKEVKLNCQVPLILSDLKISGNKSISDKLKEQLIEKTLKLESNRFFENLKETDKVLFINQKNFFSQHDSLLASNEYKVDEENKIFYGNISKYVPIENETYDCIVFLEGLNKVDNIYTVPEILWNLLKAGGKLLIGSLFSHRLFENEQDYFRLTPNFLFKLFKDYGFELTDSVVTIQIRDDLNPVYTNIVFQKPLGAISGTDNFWCMNKGTSFSHLINSSKMHHFTNKSPYTKELEEFWENKLGSDKYSCVAVCNGTVGLDILAKLYPQVKQWGVQSFTFWSDFENSLVNAKILKLRTDNICGPSFQDILDKKVDGIIVTAVFGLLDKKDQLEYVDFCKKNNIILLFDNAAVVDPTLYEVGDGSMISFHETKPIGRGEGALLIVPKNKGQVLKDLIAFVPAKQGTNAKMSDFSAKPILDWQKIWYSGVKDQFIKMYYELTKDRKLLFNSKMPGTCLPFINHKKSQKDTSIHTKKYYHPLCSKDEDPFAWYLFENSFCVPLKPFLAKEKYDFLKE
jgi:dTDP-4-amino-4,6-dideoxygalactose transaminase